MKRPKILSLKVADAPRYGVAAYGIVQSGSRSNRVNHTVAKRGRNWVCSCEHHIFTGLACKHIRAAVKRLAQRKAA